MSGIKITYSWEDEEEIIECKKEDAWEIMCQLSSDEIVESSMSEESLSDVMYDYTNCEITLHYHCDDEYCYYRYVEEDEN